ncbi:glycosyl hydrolase [Streptomyces scopuliridis]|uniref:glycosyl hydrolase n=1 Tax=Streptomyces scopuliridis TaxID=452529 RepID=UPI0036CDE13D
MNLLGFNEPDSADQANITPEQALDLWPQWEKTGLNLGAGGLHRRRQARRKISSPVRRS